MSDLHEFNDDPTRSERTDRRRRRRRRRLRTSALLLVLVVVLGGSGYLVFGPMKGMVEDFAGNDGDYSGTGNGSVMVTIESGASGRSVANDLVDKNVIKSSQPFLDALQHSDAKLQPGEYKLRHHMSGQAAVEQLQESFDLPTFTIPEGFRRDQMAPVIAKASDLKKSDIADALHAEPQTYGLPADLKNIEGFLYPATYKIKPHESATDVVQTMVDRMQAALTNIGVTTQNQRTVLTKASLVQAESPGKPKVDRRVARVFLNRLDPKNKQTDGKLQSDATVSYIFGNREDASTTKKQRKSKNPYNTYRYKGLPPGPINSPGMQSIKAVLNPADGPWMYFVTVNPDTGKTKFAKTYKQHKKNVKQYQSWLKKHRDHEKGAKQHGKQQGKQQQDKQQQDKQQHGKSGHKSNGHSKGGKK